MPIQAIVIAQSNETELEIGVERDPLFVAMVATSHCVGLKIRVKREN